jgi:serine/threonine-protein kinase
VTASSDIYSLGLVLYEIFTGREAFAGETIEQLRRSRTSGSASRPSTLVDDMDPVVESVIMRCLEPDPAQRPQSAIAVAAGLPGGDPLALALAAGETPSPEMVAHAGVHGSLRPAVAVTLLAALVVLAGLAFINSARQSVLAGAPIELPTAVLLDRARQALAAAGQEPRAAHEAWHFDIARAGLEWLQRDDPSPDRWQRLQRGFPSTYVFHYRGSPEAMTPSTNDGRVTDGSPPFTTPGMTSVRVDGAGRLRELQVVPPAVPPGGSADPAWTPLLEAAGLDPAALATSEPLVTPPMFVTQRTAWEGTWPDDDALPIRVEAGAIGGMIVMFRVMYPWDLPGADDPEEGLDAGIFWVPMILTIVIAAGLLAWRHLQRGRGDRRGAMRLAIYVFGLNGLIWILGADHVAGMGEFESLARGVSGALLAATIVWGLYMAVEPYARRYWPHVLVSWSRLITGRWRDPLVGRDVLCGFVAGLVPFTLARFLEDVLVRFGAEPSLPATGSPAALLGGRHLLAELLEAQTGLGFFMGMFVLLLLLRVLLRRQWLASIAFVLIISIPIGLLESGTMAFLGPMLFMLCFLFVMLRLGLLSLLVVAMTGPMFFQFPTTLDTGDWYFLSGLAGLIAVLVPAAIGFWISLGGQPLFKDDLG